MGFKGDFKDAESRFEQFYLTDLTISSSSAVKVEATFKKIMSNDFVTKSIAAFFTLQMVRVACARLEKNLCTETVRKYLVASPTSKRSSFL